MSRPDRRRYRPELDGLRAVAVAVVVVHHAVQPARFAGFVGVDVFFVLSGYLITGNLAAELARSGRLRLATFYRRRLLRLYPALLTMLLVTVAAAPLLGYPYAYLAKRALLAAAYVGNVWMTATGSWLGPFTHTWSLALEEQYYLVWPVVLWAAFALRVPRRVLFAVLAVLGVVTAVFTVAEFRFGTIGFPVRTTSCGLIVGSALALSQLPGRAPSFRAPWLRAPWLRAPWLRAPWLRAPWFRTSAPVVAAVVAVAGLVAFSLTDAVADGAYVVAAVAGTAALIAHTTADPTGRAVRLLSWRPLVAVGRISYGIYLWHYPVLFLLIARWPQLGAAGRVVVVAGWGTALAAVSFRYVEAPFLRRKDRLGAVEAPTAPPGGGRDTLRADRGDETPARTQQGPTRPDGPVTR